MRIASLDVGSYSVRLTVADVLDHEIKIVKELGRITSLASRLSEDSLLKEDRMEETLEVIKEFVEEAKKEGADRIVAVATEALRKAKNSQEFLKKVKEETGVDLQIISPQEEGKLAFLATAFSLKPEGFFVVIDQGGGSTEFVFGEGLNPKEIISIPMGIVNLTERFLKDDPPTQEQLDELEAFIRRKVKGVVREVDEIVGLGGTITTVCALEKNVYPYDPKKIHGSRLSRESLEKWFNTLKVLPAKERSERFKQIEDRRAEVILAGILMFIVILEGFSKDSLLVGDWGVKHGLIVKELLLP